MSWQDEEAQLRSVALQNAQTIMQVRLRAEQELLAAKEALERKTLELELSLAMMRATLESTTDAVMATDANGVVTAYNTKYLQMWNLAPNLSLHDHTAVLDEVQQLFSNPQAFRARLSEIYSSAMPETFDLLETKDRRLIERYSRIQFIGGRDAGRVWSFRDVTRRRNAEQTIRETAERLQVAMVAGQLGDWRWDVVSDRVELSQRACEIFGLLPAGNYTWNEMQQLLHEDDRERVRVAIDEALTQQKDYDVEYRVQRPGGELYWVAARGRGLYGTQNTVLAMSGVVQDISQNKQREAALLESEQRFRATFNQAAVGIAVATLEGKFLELNERFAAILGYRREELLQLTFLQITDPEYASATRANVELLLEGKIAEYAMEKKYVRKDGKKVWSHTTVTLLYDAEGKPTRFVGVVEDITQRKTAEEALRKSEEFSRTIIESSRDCIKILTLDGTLTWMSEVGRMALCINDIAEVVGRSWAGLWPADEAKLASEAVAAAAAGGTGNFVGHLDIAGQTSWWDVVLTPITDVSGKPESLLAVSREITERKKAEQALHEQTRVLEVLNRTGASIASSLDLETLVQTVTDAATQLTAAQFGAFFYNVLNEQGEAFMLYTLSGAPREAFEEFGHPRATPVFAPTFRGEGVIRLADVTEDPRYGQWGPSFGMPKGHLPVRSYLAVPVTSRSGEVIGGLFFGHSDVNVFTERSEKILVGLAAQAAIAIDNARLYEAAQKASIAKSTFLANMSHELRTPLNAIIGYAEMLQEEERRNDTTDFLPDLAKIQNAGRHLLALINDVLDLAKIEAGRMELHVSSVEVLPLIDEVTATLYPLVAKNHNQLTVHANPNVGIMQGDEVKLRQILYNLLSNATKFTEDGTIELHAEREADPNGDIIVLRVKDTGMGMSQEELTRLFRDFTQLDPSSTRRHGGTGLGLSISRRFAEMMDGSIEAQSEKDKGSTFTVKLPAVVTATPRAKVQ